MALQSGKLFATNLINSKLGQDTINSFSGMIHRRLDETTDQIQQKIKDTSDKIKHSTSTDSMTQSLNTKLGGRRTRRKIKNKSRHYHTKKSRRRISKKKYRYRNT